VQHPYNAIRSSFSFLLLCAVLALPSAAFSQDITPPDAPRLVAGNIGWGGGHWLYVLDAPSMSGRISWYALNDDVTYQVQLATDASFNAIAFDLDGLDQTWIEPNLPAGFYYFRVGASDASGNHGPWSTTGTAQRVEDSEPPSVTIISPSAEQPPSGGETVAIELEVVDDTVLRLALFSINGEYVGSLGLNGVDWKLVPSLGTPRIVVFDAPMPKKGNSSSLDIVVTVTDVVGNATTTSTVVGSGDSTKGGKGGKGKGHNK
jgi:hypothetical protein